MTVIIPTIKCFQQAYKIEQGSDRLRGEKDYVLDHAHLDVRFALTTYKGNEGWIWQNKIH
jgi:hypothetical protein